jgi:hypothetical protein
MTDGAAVLLPEGFEPLQPFADTWGKLETQEERYLLRQHSAMQELKAFYDAATPRLDAVFNHLDKFPMDKLPGPEAALYRTVLGLTEAAIAVEAFNQPCVPYAPFPHKVGMEWNQYK